MVNTIKTNVCIIGAGPGGATAALYLAKKGVDCVVADKAFFPRDKICGDAISGKVVDVMKKLDPELVDKLAHAPWQMNSWGVSFIAPNLQQLDIPFQKDYQNQIGKRNSPGFIAKRIDFDNFLVEECRRYPSIQLMEGVEINSFEKTDGGYILRDKEGKLEVQASLVIAADGAHSPFARRVASMQVEPKHHSAAIRAYYKGVSGMHPDGFIELHFLKDFLPGYFWIFPLPNGYANVGLGMRSDMVSKKKVNLKTMLPEIIEKYPNLKERFKQAEPAGKIQGFGLPLGSKKRPLSGDHFLLVGDAASLIDPFTGEGIGNAMKSGLCAGEQAIASLEKNDFSAAYLKDYDVQVYKRLWSELRLSRTLQELVNYPWLFNFIVRKANRNPMLGEMISTMFDDIDLRARLKKPSFYFKLLFS